MTLGGNEKVHDYLVLSLEWSWLSSKSYSRFCAIEIINDLKLKVFL